MKKIHSLAFCALVTPAITLGTGSVLAEQSAGPDMEQQQQSSQPDHGAEMYDSMNSADRQNERGMSHKQNTGYMSAAPANSMQASKLIGANVIAESAEEVGSVSDLIIGQNGQVVAIVVGVGGFLGIGTKDVAIGWDQVSKSSSSEKLYLRINVSRQDLQSAPVFEKQK